MSRQDDLRKAAKVNSFQMKNTQPPQNTQPPKKGDDGWTIWFLIVAGAVVVSKFLGMW